jgi:carbon-monoxide dehydrogenase large subunit
MPETPDPVAAAATLLEGAGSVTVLTGAHSHGQGHETSFAQVVAEKLNVSIENVEVVHGDTDKIPFGVGTFGSRSISLAGGALSLGLDKVVAEGKRIAAHVLEASADEIDFIVDAIDGALDELEAELGI